MSLFQVICLNSFEIMHLCPFFLKKEVEIRKTRCIITPIIYFKVKGSLATERVDESSLDLNKFFGRVMELIWGSDEENYFSWILTTSKITLNWQNFLQVMSF